MNKFTGQVEQRKPVQKLITPKEATWTDDLTDVGWLSGETKLRAQERFLFQHGQYFDSGVRVAA